MWLYVCVGAFVLCNGVAVPGQWLALEGLLLLPRAPEAADLFVGEQDVTAPHSGDPVAGTRYPYG